MPRDNNFYNKIVDALSAIVAKLDDSYRIIQLKGQLKGRPISSIIVDVCGQNYLQVDSTPFVCLSSIVL